jgi:tetratricopeptide (TPR) repeat protein
MANIFIHRCEFDLAEFHCHRALFYAKRCDGDEVRKTDNSSQAFLAYGNLRLLQGNITEAVAFHEEHYNCVAIAYNPVHPDVQFAAGNLIECLSHKGDLDTAEVYAQMTLDSLKDPTNEVNQDSEFLGAGYYNLGNIVFSQNKDLMRAEMLARKAYRIRFELYGNDHDNVGLSANLLANILSVQGNLENETEEMYKCSLASDIRNKGLDGINTGVVNANLSRYYLSLAEREKPGDTRNEHLSLAESYIKEAFRISRKNRGY